MQKILAVNDHSIVGKLMTLMYLHENRIDDLDLAKIPIVPIKFNSRRMNYFDKAL